jgi:hypothetical protein
MNRYDHQVQTEEQALAHLFFHCCFRDEVATEDEVAQLSDKLVAAGLPASLSVRDEVATYKAYQPFLSDERAFARFLLDRVKPRYELALLSHCVELCLSDGALRPGAEAWLRVLGTEAGISAEEQRLVVKVCEQRKRVSADKHY